MSITIIIKDGKPRGETRSLIDEKMRDKWGSSSFKNEADRDKCLFAERQMKKKTGMDDPHISTTVLNRIDEK